MAKKIACPIVLRCLEGGIYWFEFPRNNRHNFLCIISFLMTLLSTFGIHIKGPPLANLCAAMIFISGMHGISFEIVIFPSLKVCSKNKTNKEAEKECITEIRFNYVKNPIQRYF